MDAASAPRTRRCSTRRVSEAARTNDPAKAKDAVAQITDRYAGTGYAPRAALLYASMLYDAGDARRREAQLQWAIDHAEEDELKAIARYRLAQVADRRASSTTRRSRRSMRSIPMRSTACTRTCAATRSPPRVARADARTAYETALAKLDPKSQYRNYVQVKLDALGGVRRRPLRSASAAPAPPTRRRRRCVEPRERCAAKAPAGAVK